MSIVAHRSAFAAMNDLDGWISVVCCSILIEFIDLESLSDVVNDVLMSLWHRYANLLACFWVFRKQESRVACLVVQDSNRDDCW